jgi:hypothetical protein
MGDRSISSIVAKNLVKSKYSNTEMGPGRERGEGREKGDNERDWKFSRSDEFKIQVAFGFLLGATAVIPHWL